MIHALICQLLCGAKRCIVVLVSPRRALVKRAVGVHRAGGHSRGARTALLLVVLAATLLYLLPVPLCGQLPPQMLLKKRRSEAWLAGFEAASGAGWAALGPA